MAGNEQHIEYGGAWWTRVPDGTWYRWNAETQQWEAQPAGPPSAPATPPAPSEPEPVPAPEAVTPQHEVAETPQPTTTGAPRQSVYVTPAKTGRSLRPSFDVPGGPMGAAIVAGVVLVVALFGFIGFKALGGGDKDPAAIPIPTVSPYSGPVSWHGQRVVYDRAQSTSGCLPHNASEIERPSVRGRKLDDRLDFVERGMEELRGLKFLELPNVTFVSEKDIIDNLQSLEEAAASKVEDQELRFLKALRAVPEKWNFDDATAPPGSVLGYYEPRTEDLFVRESVGKLKVVDELTIAHEIEHSLADQNFDLEGDTAVLEEDQDASAAWRALIEGDAVLSSGQFDLLLGSSDIDLVRVADAARATELAALPKGKRVPYFYVRESVFPYTEGPLFVCELYAIDGWDAVNDAYTDPPPTTADVLYPGRYIFKITPEDPEDPPALDASWHQQEPFEFGASSLLWLLQAPGGRPDRRLVFDGSLAKRWNGGEAFTWTKGSDLAAALTLIDGGEEAKNHKPSPTLCARMYAWADAAFHDAKKTEPTPTSRAYQVKDRSVVVSCMDSGPRVAVAPTLKDARTIAGI